MEFLIYLAASFKGPLNILVDEAWFLVDEAWFLWKFMDKVISVQL